MLNLLEFTFQDIWHFLGICALTILVGTIVVDILDRIANIFRKK